MQEQLTRIGTLLARTRADLGQGEGPEGARDWLERGAAAVLDLIRRAWQCELFSATETSEVAGRVVTVDYGVTVGKTVGVLALFLLGYAVARSVTIRFTDPLVSRAHMSPQLAQVLQRWVMSTLLLIVLLVVLRLARVPLTAFAFLDGALAIGVVYGSDTRRTIELILSAARRQPATLQDPAPQVLLGDFGSDALVFRLLYWMRLGGQRSGPAVDSDIRLDIESALRDAGIAMAFPQRDVHLDTVAPLRVELSRARAEPGSLDESIPSTASA